MDLSDSDSADPLSTYSPQNESFKNSSLKIEFPIECRVMQTMWWAVPLGLVEAIFMFVVPFLDNSNAAPPETGTSIWPLLILAWSMGLLFAFGVLWITLDLLYGVVRADETGLTWRRPFTGRKSARWEEITDYYLGRSRSKLVETTVGKCELSVVFENIEEIANLVIEKTPHIKSHPWEMKRVKPDENWSLSFTPWTGAEKWLPLIVPAALAVLFILLLVSAPSPDNRQPSLGFWWDLAPILFPLTLIFGVCALVGPIQYRMWKCGSDHRDEKLTLNAQGVVFTNNERKFEAKWNEIKAITFISGKGEIRAVQIKTAGEKVIVWQITDRTRWQRIEAILDQYAPQAMEAQKASAKELLLLENDLEGNSGAWSGDAIGAGARRWSFRTREIRAMVAFVSFFALLAPARYHIDTYVRTGDHTMPPFWPQFGAGYLLAAVIIAASWLSYRFAEILADEQGLLMRSAFHRTYRVAWGDIESIGTDAWGEFVRTRRRKFYYRRAFAPARVQELRDYIEQHKRPSAT